MARWLGRARGSRRTVLAATIALVAVCGLAGTVLADGGLFSFSSNDNPWPYAQTPPAPVLAAVGDISCQPSGPVEGEAQKDVCDTTGHGVTTRMAAQTATANQIEGIQPNLVALLGDEQYEVGRYEDFMGSFDHTYGAFKFLQRPTPGNHEFYDEHGETGVDGYGYFDYYNGFQLNPDGTIPTVAFGAAANEPVPASRARPARSGRPGTGGTPTTSAPGTSSRSTPNAPSSLAAAARTGRGSQARPSGSPRTSRATTPPARWPTGTSRRSAQRARRAAPPGLIRKDRPPMRGGSCCTRITPI